MPAKPPSDELPSAKALTSALSHTVYTSTGATTTLNDALPSTYRCLVIFIRNFLCGNCQQFLLTLSQLLPPSSLPPHLSIIIVGCGAPSLIPSYNDIVQCPYPIFTDPSNKLYGTLGCQKSLSLGSRNPEYIQHSLILGALKSVVQGIKRVGSGDMLSAGDMSVNGGDFLFVKTQEKVLVNGEQKLEDGWKVDWCHRMRNTRDHTEVGDLRVVLDIPSSRDELEFKESEAEVRPIMRRATTTKMHRAISKRSQSWVQTLTRSSTLKSGPGAETRPWVRKFHSHSASVQIVSAS